MSPWGWRRRTLGWSGVLAELLLGCAVTGVHAQEMNAFPPSQAFVPAAQIRGEPGYSILASPQSPRPFSGCFGSTILPGEGTVPTLSLKQLVRMSGPELEQLYRQSSVGGVPIGRVRGRVIVRPGTRLAVPASKAARVVWQGKVFDDDQCGAVNRFFGVKIIRARVYLAESWLDGQPSLILDYHETSRLYAPYRDEIREVAPGLYLGYMYDRRTPQPTLKMLFALEATR
jgi:hypothetical protein